MKSRPPSYSFMLFLGIVVVGVLATFADAFVPTSHNNNGASRSKMTTVPTTPSKKNQILYSSSSSGRELRSSSDNKRNEWEEYAEMTAKWDEYDVDLILDMQKSTSTSTSQASAVVAMPTLETIEDKKLLHLGTLIVGTLWWYIFSCYEFFSDPREIFGLTEGPLYYAMSAYVPMSQVCTYFFLWQLMTAKTLRAGQAWIVACIFACVPADTIIVVFDPTGSKSLTVVAFTLVTVIYGVILSYYVRQAASLEPPVEYESDVPVDSPNGILQEVIDYRPPEKLQNFHMAIDFARAFGAFTVTVAAIKDQLLVGDSVGPLYFPVLGIVVAHAALEMTIATVFPGLYLEEKYPSFLKFQIVMSLFQMFAATYIAHEAPDAEDLSVWDDLVYSCLFGSAAAGLSEQIEILTGNYDFDDQLGMSADTVDQQKQQQQQQQKQQQQQLF